MSLHKYFKIEKRQSFLQLTTLPTKVSLLTDEELRLTNRCVERSVNPRDPLHNRVNYNGYTAEERAAIGRYASENGATRASVHFSKLLRKRVPETTARRFKNEYLDRLQQLLKESSKEKNTNFNKSCDSAIREPLIKALPIKPRGRPVLLGELDLVVQDYIKNLRAAGGVVNTMIVMSAAKGIISAKDGGLLAESGGYIEITKAWAKSILKRMGYVKRKASNAGKVTLSNFAELKEEFLADISAEVLMNDIPPQLIFNWDQTAIQLVPTGQWTMNQAKDKVISIAHSDDKRQITAVVAASMSGECIPIQLLYQGKTVRCHPKISFPENWDVWHSINHWSNEETMIRYIKKIIVPFVSSKREALKLDPAYPALAIMDGFRGQTTESEMDLLKENNIVAIRVPANCTDKLQPIDVSVNKPIKDMMRSKFQTWYASKVAEQLKEVSVANVKVDISATVIKPKCASWLISTLQNLQQRPEVFVNGFKGAGIWDAVMSVISD